MEVTPAGRFPIVRGGEPQRHRCFGLGLHALHDGSGAQAMRAASELHVQPYDGSVTHRP